MKYVKWVSFRKALKETGIDPRLVYWRHQWYLLNAGNRGPEMHENAIAAFSACKPE